MARITAKLTSGMAVRLSNERHEWQADEPIDAARTDSEPKLAHGVAFEDNATFGPGGES
jgi:hypothetical protein